MSLWKGDLRVSQPITMKSLLEQTAGDHNLTVGILMSPARYRAAAYARHDFMWRARQIVKADGSHRYSMPRIARFLGLECHTSVLHGVRGHAARRTAAETREASMVLRGAA